MSQILMLQIFFFLFLHIIYNININIESLMKGEYTRFGARSIFSEKLFFFSHKLLNNAKCVVKR